MTMPVSAYFDASYSDTCGIACGGWVVQAHLDVPGLEQDLVGMQSYGGSIGSAVETECAAAVSALEAIATIGYRGAVALFGDNEQVVQEFAGQHPPSLHGLDALRKFKVVFADVDLQWVGREYNKGAHRIARRAYYTELCAYHDGRLDAWYLLRTCSGLYIHQDIAFPDGTIAVYTAGPIAEERVLVDGRPRPGWHTIDLSRDWGTLKAGASHAPRTRKTYLSIVTSDGVMVDPQVRARAQGTIARNHWHRHGCDDEEDEEA